MQQAGADLFLVPDTETGRAFRATDWARTPLGPLDAWPAALRVAVQTCLNSQFPMTLAWGEALINIYNDGYLPIVGAKHPGAFAAPVYEVYPEIRDFLEPMVQRVREAREAVWASNLLIPLTRRGRPEEGYFTFCYSPLADEDGQVRGVLSVATETTPHVLAQRREGFAQALAGALAGCASARALASALAGACAEAELDFGEAEVALIAASGEIERAPARAWQDVEAGPASAGAALEPDFAEALERAVREGAPAPLRDGLLACADLGRPDEPGPILALFARADPLVARDDAWRAHLSRAMRAVEQAGLRLSILRGRDRLYGLIFRNSQDGILLTAPDGSIIAANPAACALLGYAEEEIIALGRAGLISDTPGLEEMLEARRRTGRSEGVLNWRRKDGTILQSDHSSVLFHDEASGTERSVILFRDAAPRQLAEQRATAAARLEAVGQLTGGISHDFNNLLHVIIGSAEDLTEGGFADAAQRRAAELILSASQRAADLTRQLLNFSRREPVLPRPVRTGEVFEEIDQILSRALGEQVRVEIDIENGAMALVVDPSQLQSAILNLALNARDAMPGGGRLRVECRRIEVEAALAGTLGLAPGCYIRIAVADTGVGIPPDDLARVTEPFFTTKELGAGSGLGLSMAEGFARRSGGALQIESELGRGATVSLYFPCAAPESGEAEPSSASEPASAFGAAREVLVVEDNDLVATSLGAMLERAGFAPVICSTPEAAFAELNARPAIALLLSDIVLGAEIDGWGIAEAARRLRPGLPVILMTGFMDMDDAGSVSAQSCTVLRKPFRQAEMLSAIAEKLA